MNISKVLLVFNQDKENAYQISNKIINLLLDNKVITYASKEVFSKLNNAKEYNKELVDLILVLGGDGTLLNYAHKYNELNVPFYGINNGRVGALMEARLDNYQELLLEVIKGNYKVEERNTLLCQVSNNKEVKEYIGFNEVVISRGSLFKMININLKINNHSLTSFYADGVIVSTSTGSSAYNLSCGGPLLMANAHNFVITPIAPQLKTITSLVINDSDVVELDISENNNRQVYDEINHPILVIDGKYRIPMNELTKITIHKGNNPLRIIKTEDKSLFDPMIKVAHSTQKM